MRTEVMQHYSLAGLAVPLNQAGYFETTHHQQLMKDIKGAVFEGRLIAVCGVVGTDVESILTEDAIDLLATKLRTPLQIQLHLTLAFEAGYRAGEKPVSAALVESVLSRQLDDLEPTLTRHGYRIKNLVEQFDAKPAEIKALFSNSLEPAKAATLRDKMLAAGLPI